MKLPIHIHLLIVLSAVFFTGSVYGYTPDDKEEACKKPKYREFSLPEFKAPENAEVPPESEFSFTLSVWANKETIKLTAKKQPIPFTVETTSTFHRVKAKLPAALNGQFVRIDATVKAILGCDEQMGWLVKVAEKK